MIASEYVDLWRGLKNRLAGPTVLVLGAPRTVAGLAAKIERPGTVCYQMDQYQGERTREALVEIGFDAKVVVAPDLWDLPPEFGSVVMPSPPRGERELKLDIVEQAFHVLKEKGLFGVLSPIERDKFYQPVMKKVFGKVAMELREGGTVFWSPREGERKRRRHEVAFPVRVFENDYRDFLSRPGVFAYGKLDDGAKSMLDVLEVRPEERIVELGCGTGAVGITAALRSGRGAHVTLADSNTRAIAVAELNAQKHGLKDYATTVTSDFANLTAGVFDLALANPPYYAHQAIARLFVERSHALLRRGGRLYLVTRQVEDVEPIVESAFGPVMVLVRRDYAILVATRY